MASTLRAIYYFLQSRAKFCDPLFADLYIYMHVCMYVCFFISQLQHHESKHKNTLIADKKEVLKNDKRYRTCKQYTAQI